jgi:BatD DUF11 like domain
LKKENRKKTMRLINKFLILLLISFQGIVAQIKFEATVSKATLGLNETLRVDFTMNDDGDNFQPPNFEGFKVVGGPSQQVSQTWINGRGTFNKSYSYYLAPLQKGVLTIKPAFIEINRQLYKSNPVKVTVTNAIPKPRDPSQASTLSADTELHMVAEISKTNPYVNEPITVVYKLYFSHNIGLTDWREVSKPKFNDFWSQNIEIKQLVDDQTTYNGESYRSVIFKKVVLYPQKAGKLELDPFAMDFDVQLPTGRRNIFGEMQIVEDSKTVSSGTKTITVKPLPEAGKPIDFSGAVGNFSFKASPSKTSLKSGESLNLDVRVSGTGNLKLFSLPKPEVPSALEMYDPEHNENVQVPLSGMTGSISDSYSIIPQFKGKYPIKSMRFSYFDPSARSYKTIVSPEIMVDVLEGPEETEAVAISSSKNNPKAKIKKNLKFIEIASKTELVNTNRKDFLGSTKYYLLQFLPFFLIPCLILFRRKKEALDSDTFGNRIKNNNKLARKYLSEAKKQLANKEKFYVSLEKAMHNFLKAKLHIETTEMSKINIQELLLDKYANPETVSEFIQLTENCEMARFSPSSTETIQNDYEKAVVLINDLEKQLNLKERG